MPIVHRSTSYQLTSEIVVTRASIATPRLYELWPAAALMIYGAFLMSYSAWAATSDRKAAVLFHSSPSCELRTHDSTSFVRSPCRIEFAEVVERRWYSTKGDRAAYKLVTRSMEGGRDDMHMDERESLLFWRRVAPGETISVQRFLAPGYRLTGSVTALGDKRGWIMMPAHPDRDSHNESRFILFGAVLCTGGALLVASWIRRSRRMRDAGQSPRAAA